MSDSKKTIEKNPQGEFEFTPYGEFLSYFHAHLEIFKRFARFKNFQSAKIDGMIQKLKSYMASHVKNVDQYFPNIPKFAEIMGVSQKELSDFLNQNFLEVLPIVQDKFKKAEIKKLESAPGREYDRVTEEILETTGFRFPEGKVFKPQGNLVVLEDTETGEILEPQGLMAGISSPPPAVIGADPKAQNKPNPAKSIPDNPLLEEIVEKFGEILSGSKLDVSSVGLVEPKKILQPETVPTSEEEVLEDIEDLDFEMPDSDSDDDSSDENETYDNGTSNQDYDPGGVLDDLGDILGMGESSGEPEPPPEEPIEEEVENFRISNYFDIIKTINRFQANKDNQGYQNWLSESSDLEKVVVSVRANHLKETKGETIPWEDILSQIETKVSMNHRSLVVLKDKILSYNWVKISLDRGLNELKKGDSEFLDWVRKAWPHIQVSFQDSPDYDRVLSNLKKVIGKIPSPEHRKELGRVMTLVLNFLKTKYPNSDTSNSN